MKQLVGVILCLVLSVCAAGCKNQADGDKERDPRRHVEKVGGFSYVPPENWTVQDYPGLKFKIVVGPRTAGFVANINIVDEAYQGNLDEYVKANIVTMQANLKKFRLVKQEEFKTTAGLQGERMIIENQQQDKLLRQTFYFFGTPGMKYVVTGSTLAEGGEKLDAVFEKCMKTFRFENP